MTERTLLCLAVSFLTGITYGRYQVWYLPAGLLLLLIMTGIPLMKRLGRNGIIAVGLRVLLCLMVLIAGAFRFKLEQEKRNDYEKRLTEGDILTVSGEIARKEEKNQQFIYDLKDTKLLVEHQTYPGNGIRIYSSKSYRPGSKLLVKGRYEEFRTPRNEGNFNEKQYYQSKKIEFKVTAEEEKLLGGNNPYVAYLSVLREKLKAVLTQSMPEKEAGVMITMTLGEKSLLDTEIKELYQKSGISHVLAISGLHVSILGMGIYRMLKYLHCPRIPRIILAGFVVYSFGVLSGMEVSTLRAVTMFLISMVGEVLGYAYDSITALSVSSLFQLWANPFLLDYAGFLFSYTAVIGVVVVAKIIKEEFKAKKEVKKAKQEAEESTKNRKKQINKNKRKISITGKLLETVYMSTCIQLTTLPLSLYFYYETPSYSVFNNACVLPFMGILLFLGIGGAFVGLYAKPAAYLILKPAVFLLGMNEKVCSMFLRLPGAMKITGKPDFKLLLFYYMMLAGMLWLLRVRQKRRYCIGIALSLGMLLVVRPAPIFEINVLDVGQGDGILVQSETGEGYFIDGGSSDVKKVGTYRILPFLKYKGISKITCWMVSHADSDHISGLQEILEAGYPIENLVLSQYMVQDEAWKSLISLAEKRGCQVRYGKPGTKFGIGTTKFKIVYPLEGSGIDRNASSMVVLLKHQKFFGLFTGDIGELQEQELISYVNLRKEIGSGVSFYKAAHHGSNTSNCNAILEEINPVVSVISCGRGNHYGHPGKDAWNRIEAASQIVFCTMETGQITITHKEGKIQGKCFLKK